MLTVRLASIEAEPPTRRYGRVLVSSPTQLRGRVFDVIIDLRPRSATYTEHVTVELDAASRRALYIPPGLAHGFQTLEDDTEVLYQMSDYFDPSLAGGVRWNDPSLGIRWPIAEVTVLDRDDSYPDFDASAFASDCGVWATG